MSGAPGDEHGLLAVDGVAHQAAVQHVSGDHVHAAGEVAELLRGIDQRGHLVTALERARCQEPAGAAGRAYDEDVHAGMVPAAGRDMLKRRARLSSASAMEAVASSDCGCAPEYDRSRRTLGSMSA